ncbi:MAG: tetratricopeptide repeat protein [Treponema sp.]|jgi:tetratricopeptide (TPR) repeat protein|nr:tetratricopeptide repeat protein [Treponema sp.]
MAKSTPGITALVPRTVALLILLYQIRLLAADLADTQVFIATLAGGLATAIFLQKKQITGKAIRPIEAVMAIAVVPWVVRFFIALPRVFFRGVSGITIILDSLLLNLDRNNFSALLPFYWVAFTSYFSQRSRIFLRADIIAADTFFLVLFSITPASSIEVYRWPILMIGIFALILFLQILSLVLSAPPELKIRRKERIFAGAFLFLLIFLGGALFIRPFEQKAVDRGGGLLEPKLFRFDFSRILRLESEISVNDDLVLIVKKDPDDYHILLRRYTLSGYNPKQGFFRLEDIDEAAHPQRLPNQRTRFPAAEIENFSVTDQEYYLVNFDASAFIGMNMPVEVIPFETWDASSFNSAYSVRSHVSDSLPYELIQTVRDRPGPENLRLSPEEYALYTDYGGDTAIASFTREIIQEGAVWLPNREAPIYWEQIQIIYDRLKYGEYRYSLKPGIAPDGDQLKYFLFNVKKGYCSYYAFAFTLMLRSLGIPCRVAAGFFIDPSTETFNYYPVRSDMAHAWVEVWFPGYGWIEYDPTSQIMAEGEDFRFSQGTPPELFERLMKEILENRSKLKMKEGEEDGARFALGKKTIRFIVNRGPFIALAALVVLFLAIRSGFLWLSLLSGKPRKKTFYLWAHTKHRLALAGLGLPRTKGEAEWARDSLFKSLYPLYLENAAGRFAPDYTSDGSLNMAGHYRLFCGEYRILIPFRRRLLAWLLPPLALLLSSKGYGPLSHGNGSNNGTKITGAILLFILLFTIKGDAQVFDNPDELFENAMNAQRAENWERAIELFSTGKKAHPWDSRFPWALGNLYHSRSLYHLAWDEYRIAEKIISWWDPNLLYQLANTAGYLNRNEVSANYLEKILALNPDNREAVGSLAWMYFKLHRLDEGEKLLLEAIDRLGNDMDFAMTLGTIYSDMFKYREAKDSYLEAIRGAENTGNRLFASLSHYNLSILENRFYKFSLAYDRANASLEALTRSSGRLARGELYLARLELSRALAEFQGAYGMDSSPLSKLNMAQLFQVGGRLTEAMLYARDCLKTGDDSWMLNYGIDPVRYKRDIHEILKDSYKGLMNVEDFACPLSFAERLQSIFRKISYRFYQSVHTQLYRKYSLLSADAYSVGSDRIFGPWEIHLESLSNYYNTFEAYPSRAFAYLVQARTFEEPLIPESIPTYNYEEGQLFKKRKLLEETVGEFDPIWEKDMIAKTYVELTLKGKKAEKQDAAERLFALNRGALHQNGIRLPVELRVADELSHLTGTMKRIIRMSGLDTARLDSPRYTLEFTKEREGNVSCELYDNGKGISVWKENLPVFDLLPSSASGKINVPLRYSASQRALLARIIRDGLFDVF